MRVILRVSRRNGLDVAAWALASTRVFDRVLQAGGAASFAAARVLLRVLRAGAEDWSAVVGCVARRRRCCGVATVTGECRVVGTTLGAGCVGLVPMVCTLGVGAVSTRGGDAAGGGVLAVMDRVTRRLASLSGFGTLGSGGVSPWCGSGAVSGVGAMVVSSTGGGGVVAATMLRRSRYSCDDL